MKHCLCSHSCLELHNFITLHPDANTHTHHRNVMQEHRLSKASKDTVGGEEGEGEMHGESNIEIYSTICEIDSQREFAV